MGVGGKGAGWETRQKACEFLLTVDGPPPSVQFGTSTSTAEQTTRSGQHTTRDTLPQAVAREKKKKIRRGGSPVL